MLENALHEFQDALRAKDLQALETQLAGMEVGQTGAFKMTEIAVSCKEAGFSDLAERTLLRVLDADPGFPAACYELAVLQRISGRHHLAIASLLEARKRAPREFSIEFLLVHMLHAVGAHPEAEEVARTIKPKDPEQERQLQTLKEFGQYMAEFPQGRGQLVLEEVRRRYRYIDSQQVAAEISSAIEQKRGFSLVRLGDGEGAFARISPEDEGRYPTLYASIRREWYTLLFGADFDPMATGYAALVETLMATSCEADVVGVPYQSWMEHEYRLSSIRGVPCLLNVHRNLLARREARKPTLCDQRIHIELHQHGLIEPILRTTRHIGLISCLPELPERLKARFGLESVELFKIPGERYSQSLLSAEALAGVHFPYVFWDIVRRLSQPQNGRVFLIAAGTLAKFYAAVIKRNGGVALDLGSLVDAWMNIPSRPGYDPSLAI